MKKKLTLMLAFSTMAILSSQCVLAVKPLGGDDVPKNVIKLKPIGLALGIVTLQYERAFAPHMSGACDVSFLSRSIGASSLSGGGSVNFTISGFGISPEFRYYPGSSKPAPKGFFVAPFLEFYTMGMTGTGTDPSGQPISASISGINAVGGGGLLGWQWMIGNVFSVELNFGVRYLSMSTPSNYTYTTGGQTKTETVPSVSFAGVGPAGNIAFGFAF